MPLRATAEFAWINVNQTRIETGSFGPVEVPREALLGRADATLSRAFRDRLATMPLAIAGHFEFNVYKPVPAFAVLESPVLLADAVDSFRRHCVEGLAAKGKRIDELMRQSLMLVTALAPRIGYDNAARIAKAAHLNGTSLREEARLGARQRRRVRCAGSTGSHAGAIRLNSILQPAEVNA
jgi:fumarate hydratase class II